MPAWAAAVRPFSLSLVCLLSLVPVTGQVPPLAATADFDEDGTPDRVAAYVAPGGGLLVLQGSNRDTPAIQVPVTPDFIGAGDFNADGHFDLVVAARGGRALFYLAGDGTGSFGSPVEIALPAALVALAVGDINRRDGLADVVAAVQDGAGSALLVFESPQGASRAMPEVLPLPGEATAVAIGDVDGDHEVDISVSAAGRLILVHGRDRRLSWDEASRNEVPPPAIDDWPLSLDRAPSKALALLSTPKDSPRFAGATYVVTNTSDSGAGSLRQAIIDANASPGSDNIVFNIPGSAPFTINVSGLRLTLTDPAVIDATTQPGYAGSPLVEVVGQFFVLGGNTTLRGLSIHSPGLDGFGSYGEAIILGREPGSTVQPVNGGNVVEGCYIGVLPDGVTPGSNARRSGIVITSPNNRIGGTTPAARNVISAYKNFGIAIFPSSSVSPDGNVVQGNYIGTTTAGTAALGNTDGGIILAGSSGSTIGGVTAGAGNVISGNGGAGVHLRVQAGVGATSNNLIQGNFIGTDRTGTLAIPNGLDGIILRPNDFPSLELANNLIGGTTPAARNLISGNLQGGIWFGYGNAQGNLVQGNYIGTKIDGVSGLGNGSAPPPGATHNDGIFFEGPGGNGITSGPSNHVVGGTVPGAGNVIAFSAGHGVSVTEAYRTLIAGNSIFSNSHAGIALGFRSLNTNASGNSIFNNTGLGIDNITTGPTEGVTPNDSCDTDSTFLNPLQNFPELTTANANSSTTLVKGSLNSTPNTTFTLEFFASPAADPSGYGEGKTFLGSAVVTTSAACVADFSSGLTIAAGAPAGSMITATATDPNGSTSEFSAAVPAGTLAGSSTTTTLTASPNPAAPGQTVVLTAAVTGQNPTGTVKFQEGANALGTATLSAGSAALNISTLTLGSHSITAAYQGDSANLPGTSAPVAVVIANHVDLGIAMSAAPNPATNNQPLAFTLTVTNLAATSASSVTVDHTLPANATFNSATATQGSCAAQSATLVRCTLGAVAGNGTASMTVTVTPSAATSLTSSAAVSSSETDSNLSNNTAQITVPVDATDLALALTAPDPVAGGEPLTYTIAVRNIGQRAAATVSLFLDLPTTFTFLSGSGTGVQSCRPPVLASTQAVCRLDDIPAGGQIVASLTVQPGGKGRFLVRALANSITPDSNPSNNEQTWLTTVAAAANLSVQISGAAGSQPGEVLFTVTVINTGPDAATGITLRGSMGGVATFDTSFANGGNCIQSGVLPMVCDLYGAPIPSNASVIFQLRGKAASSGLATLQLTGTLTEIDPVPGNNTATGQYNVVLPGADIYPWAGYQMSDDTPLKLPLMDGDEIHLDLGIVNPTGPLDATNSSMALEMNPADILTGGVPNGCLLIAAGKLVCNFGTSRAGSNNIRYRLTIRLVGTGLHVFKMTVQAAEYDPDPSNNTKIDQFINTATRAADIYPWAGYQMSDDTPLKLPLMDGDEIHMDLGIVNPNGPRDATNSSMAFEMNPTDILIGGVPNGCLLIAPGKLVCNFGTSRMNSNNIRYRLTVRLVGIGPHVFKMTVQAAEYDPVPADNTKIDSFLNTVARAAQIYPWAGYQMANDAPLTLPLIEGDEIHMDLGIVNPNGPRDATNSSMAFEMNPTDILTRGVPAGCLLVSKGKLVCDFGTSRMNSNNIRYRLFIRLVGTGPHVFKMTAQAAELDPVPADNTKVDSFINTIAAPPKITGSYTLSRLSGQIQADIKLTNSGGSTASGVTISAASLDVGTGPVPALGSTTPVDIPAGGSTTVRVAFPGNVFASGSRAVMILGGSYAGGSFGSTYRVILP